MRYLELGLALLLAPLSRQTNRIKAWNGVFVACNGVRIDDMEMEQTKGCDRRRHSAVVTQYLQFVKASLLQVVLVSEVASNCKTDNWR